MNNKFISILVTACAVLMTVFSANVAAQAQNGTISIDRYDTYGQKDPYPISVSGLSGEALNVLTFDLTVSGFTLVSKEKASALVSAKNENNIIAKLTDSTGENVLFNRSYKNGSTRAQAHVLAADIVKAIMGVDSFFNDKIGYCVNSAKNKNEVYTADFDGRGSMQVTGDGSMIRCLTSGRDGKYLYYTSYMKGNPDIYSHNLSTGERKRLFHFSGLNASPTISPDGTKIAMILSKDGNPELYVANVDGTNLRRLTKTKNDESAPTWSPDSQTICFSSRMSGSSRLYTISAAGGKPVRLRTTGVGSATEPDWSPDGKTIAFTTSTGGFSVCVVPAKGGQATVLAQGTDPKWASNSKALLYSGKNGKKNSLFIINVDTKQKKVIGSVVGDVTQPTWIK